MKTRTALFFVAAIAVTACSSAKNSDETGERATASTAEERAVVADYAALVRANYDDTVTRTTKLKTAIDALIATPSQATLDAARAAWMEAKPVYSQTEAFRFYGGPIDAEETGPEGRVNSWPIDENFIDYTLGDEGAGIINHAAEFPTITMETLVSQNEKGGEKNISAGWHAIEFLLWGQDFDAAGPGKRPFTDYVVGGSAKNVERRATYLSCAMDLLLDDLKSVDAAWDASKADTYASKLIADEPKIAITNILKALGSLSGSELPRERMYNAYQTKDQEEEHDCFSDTTTVDLYNNALGLENVYLGRYGARDGHGIDELVAKKNPALDAKMKERLTAALAALKAIPVPFDQAILGDDASDGRKRVKAAMDAVEAVSETVAEIAAALDIKINIE